MTEGGVTSRWQWVVLVSSFLALFITGFAQYQAGVLKVALLRHMDSDVSTTTWLMAYYAGSFALTAPVGSLLINLASCRTCVTLSGVVCLLGFVLSSLVTDVTYLFFTLTLLGVGQGMCNTGAIVILGYYFPDRTSIATGVCISGGALGMFVHPPLLQALVDWCGLRGALLLSGAVAFQGSVFGALMRPCRLEIKATKSKRGGNCLQKLCVLFTDVCRPNASSSSSSSSSLMSWTMAIYLTSVLTFSLAIHALMVLLPFYLIHAGGMTPTQASFTISVSGVGSFFSRLVAGFLAHDPRIGQVLVYCGLSGVQVLVSLAAPSLIATGIVGSYAYCFMVGLYTGGVFTLLYPMLNLIVDLHHSATAYGMVLFAVGVGALLGAPLTELVQSQSSHPYVMFGFIGALFCVSAVFGSLVASLSTPPDTTPDPHKNSSPLHTDHLPEDPDGDEKMELYPMLTNTIETVIEESLQNSSDLSKRDIEKH